MTIHSFSFGGGVQSTAALVLAAQGKLPATDDSYRWDVFLFANVGDRAEHPATLAYVEDVAKPFAAKNRIELREVRRLKRDKTPNDLLDRIEKNDRSLPFPVRMNNGMPGRRSCTAEFKINPIERELRRMGAAPEDGKRAIVGIGISLDEIQRAKGWGEVDPRSPTQIREYPLLRLGIRRRDALAIIAEAGLPEPPRSACWFCPFHSLDEWRRLRREQPELFDRAVALEARLNERQAEQGKPPIWLTRYAKPLSEVVQDQLVIDLDQYGAGDAPCDSGHCFT